jgi:O-antigen ligase
MKVALKLGFDNPVFGVGISHFLYHAAAYVPYSLDVHNVFLLIFSEVGLPALAVFVAIICYNFRLIGRLMKRKSSPEASQLGRILLVQQVGVIVNTMFIPVAYEVILWITLALPSIAVYAFREGAGREADG